MAEVEFTDLPIITDLEDDVDYLPFRDDSSGLDSRVSPKNLVKRGGLVNLLGGISALSVWSNSDANKGLGTIVYDNLAGGTFSPGDTITAVTSGAVCKVISDNGTTTMVVGAAAGRFQDNEQIGNGAGVTADVNIPPTGAGPDLVRNGDFTVDQDPPQGWTPSNATLTTEAGGKVGNCMKVLGGVPAGRNGYQNLTVEAGKIYKWEFYYKVTAPDVAQYRLYDVSNASDIIATTDLPDTAGVWSAKQTHVFEAPAGCTSARIYCYAKNNTDIIYWDEIACYEITPCCTGNDNLACDGWYKDVTCDIYRVHNDGGNNTKDGSFYSLLFVTGNGNDFIYLPSATGRVLAEWTQLFAGRTMTFGLWAKTSTATHVRIQFYDGTTQTWSDYHTGGGAWEWLEVTATIQANPTAFSVGPRVTQASGNFYISQPTLGFGSSIGEGNYVLAPGEVVLLDGTPLSNLFNATTGWSDTGWKTDYSLEADFDAMLPKGAKVVWVRIETNDSGSAAGPAKMLFRSSTTHSWAFSCSPEGLANDEPKRDAGMIICNSNGDFDYIIDASGANTFDIPGFVAYAVQIS